MTNEAKPRVYDILAKAFAQEDVRTCFALLGDANMNWAARLSEEGCRMVLCQARALRARCRHGVLAKELGSGRGDRHVRARCDAIDHGAPRSRARPSAAGGVRRGSAAEKRLVQPGNRPGTAHHRNGCRLSQPAHARAHACCNTRRVPAGASRTSPRSDRYSVRSAGPAVGRTCGSAQALAQIVAAPSPIPPHPDDVASAAQLVAGAERVVVLAGLGAVEARAGALAGRWQARRVDCCPRRFPREGCSTTILFASASRAASHPRPALSTSRRPTSSSRSAAR